MISRRKWLGYGAAIGGTAVQALVGSRPAKGQLGSSTLFSNQGLWIYHRVEPAIAEKLAYEGHSKNGCSCGVFAGILTQLADSYGEPYRSFPLKMIEFGNGGIGGYGSTCGGLVGAAAAIGLFFEGKTRGELITHLFQWYEKTELPLYQPPQPLVISGNIPTVTTQSVLCSNSKSAWCQKSGFGPDSKERRERCFRLSADIGRKTAELLNASVNG
jgi:hypothetical protein